MRSKITCYDNPTVGSGSVVNEAQFSYNDFGQLVTDYQEHGGAVNTSTSPKVQYGYAAGGDNTIRPTSTTYPDGRVLAYHYGSSGGIDDALSRVSALIDDDGSTHLADYSYLGLGRPPLPLAGDGRGEGIFPSLTSMPRPASFVQVDYPQPDLLYTLIGTAGGDDPDTGDIYRGLDRFGRVKDSYWRDYGASADADRIKYGYDRMASRTYREQTVDTNSNYDELYSYDLIQRLKSLRLKSLDRGTLGAQKDQITGLNFAQCWGLDATGNWRNFRQDDDGAAWDLVQSRTANQVNEITDIMESTGPAWITPLYNRAGNMTRVPKPSDPTNYYACTYDAWNRLVKLTEGANTVAEYAYDGAKRRTVKKTYSGGALDETRHFYYTEPSKWQVVEERVDSSSHPDRQFVWGLRYVDDLILRDRDTDANGTLDERLYALQDANWNLTAIAGTDGTIEERYAYSAYGTPAVLTPAFSSRASSSYAWETRFAGYRFDSEVDLYQVRHRVLRPALGWLQRDPIAYEGGAHVYAYVDGSPLVRTDPTGEGWWPWEWPIWPWNWGDDAVDGCATCGGAGAPAGTGEAAGGLGCIAEMCQPNNIENYLKRQMDIYELAGPKSEYLNWKRRYEKCRKMREDAAKKRAEEARKSGCCK
jgi:RHS repeat-associated protein